MSYSTRLLAEILHGAGAFALGANFAAIVKSPSHLRALLSDRAQLTDIVKLWGPDLGKDAASMTPLIGSYPQTLAIWEKAQNLSLCRPRTAIVVVTIVLLVGAAFFGVTLFVVAVCLFVLPLLFQVPESAKNNNVRHLRFVSLNLTKWNQEDAAGCLRYCTNDAPNLALLHEVLVAAEPA